jgi:serine/threonine-protein phosphatase PGAM5
MAERHIYLVRHGQREPGDGADTLGPALTAMGRQQAALAAERLSALEIDVIHTSSFRRTTQTAQIIAAQFPNVSIRPSRLLWECIPALPDYAIEWHQDHPTLGEASLPLKMLPWIGLWSDDTNWEQVEAGFEQAQQAWQKYFTPARGIDRHEIIVCHGNILRYFVMCALQAPPEAWINTDIYNCGISEVVIKEFGEVMLLSHNDHGHLPPEMKTFK